MINEPAKYIEKTFLSPEELIPQNIKARTLNLITDRLKTILDQTTDAKIVSLTNTLKRVVDDAYVISMYKFQFKLFTLEIEKEISVIEQMVAHG